MTEQDATTFTHEVVRDDGVVTVKAAGEIDLASSPALRSALQELVEQGAARIVVDLEGVTFIDSSGLGVLVGLLKRVNERGDGTQLVLRGLHGPVRKVFEITGLLDVFTVEG